MTEAGHYLSESGVADTEAEAKFGEHLSRKNVGSLSRGHFAHAQETLNFNCIEGLSG